VKLPKFEVLKSNSDQKLPNGMYSKTHEKRLKNSSVFRPK